MDYFDFVVDSITTRLLKAEIPATGESKIDSTQIVLSLLHALQDVNEESPLFQSPDHLVSTYRIDGDYVLFRQLMDDNFSATLKTVHPLVKETTDKTAKRPGIYDHDGLLAICDILLALSLPPRPFQAPVVFYAILNDPRLRITGDLARRNQMTCQSFTKKINALARSQGVPLPLQENIVTSPSDLIPTVAAVKRELSKLRKIAYLPISQSLDGSDPLKKDEDVLPPDEDDVIYSNDDAILKDQEHQRALQENDAYVTEMLRHSLTEREAKAQAARKSGAKVVEPVEDWDWLENGWPTSNAHWQNILSDIREMEIGFANDGADSKKEHTDIPLHCLDDLNDLWAQQSNPNFLNLKAVRSAEITLNSSRSLLVCGKSGVGKSLLIRQLVYRMNCGECQSRNLLHYHLYRLDPNAIFSGTVWRGQLEARIQTLLNFLKEPTHRGMILVFDDLSLLTGFGGSQADHNGMADLLTGPLANREITMVGCCSDEQFLWIGQHRPGFARCFSQVELQEPKDDVLLDIFRASVKSNEERTHLKGMAGLAEEILAKTKLLENGEANPAKGLKLIDRVFDFAQIAENGGTVDAGLLDRCIEDQYDLKIPRDPAKKTYQALRANLKGQDEAIDLVYQRLLGVSQGINSPDKPLLSLAFFGPSGVGKTETARIIAREFCGSERALVKIDAGQFNTAEDCDALFNGPNGGILINALRQNPRCCILIDEVEKAPKILAYNLMAMLDDGIVHDGYGRPQSAKGAIIILTSNCGGSYKVGEKKRHGFLEEQTKNADVEAKILASFPNEFLGRVDQVVVFHHLPKRVLEDLVKADLAKVQARSSAEIRRLPWSKADTAKVLAQSHVDEQGARAIEKSVEAVLMAKLFRSERSGDKGEPDGKA